VLLPSDGEERARLHLESEQAFPHAKREVESDNEGEAEVVRCNDGVVLRDAAGEGGGGVAEVGGEAGSGSESGNGSGSESGSGSGSGDDESEGREGGTLGICRGKTSRHVAQVVVCSMNSNTNRTVACALLCVIGCACLFASA
jgi:hypothetical protein